MRQQAQDLCNLQKLKFPLAALNFVCVMWGSQICLRLQSMSIVDQSTESFFVPGGFNSWNHMEITAFSGIPLFGELH